ncbi:discoidin domain-containing protein [Parapedobacter tibetensis]|uniref:discoidin domain-containing protein n=1 Tax=Parapedobacter tibetensis TaxID=2972951 RepID=UPI00214D6AD3|nr:discoidin domain-containing protein [Parapedobacter tibetensis]
MSKARVAGYRLVAAIFLLESCISGTPDRVEAVLQLSDDNRPELQKVITYYKQKGNKEKLDAAYYLIGNLEGKSFWDGDIVMDFDSIFYYLDSLDRENVLVTIGSPLVERRWTSLEGLYGTPSSSVAELWHDYEYLNADHFIAHIDQAFRLREELPWAKRLSFGEFCEYILPHRIGNERPELWNAKIYEDFQAFRDTAEAQNRLQLTANIQAYLKSKIFSNRTFWKYPFDIPASKMEIGKRGACRHLVIHTSMVMRANGLPVGMDHIPLWGNRNGGHYWNTLLQEDGSYFAFDAVGGRPFGQFERPHYSIAKVYRHTFRLQDLDLPPDAAEDIPAALLARDRIDVTAEYTDVYDLAIPLTYPFKEGNKKFAVICTFDNKNWQAQHWGEINGGKAMFKDMGAGVVYIAMYYDGKTYYPASDPFLLNKNGDTRYLHISRHEKQDMVLKRKFPRFPAIEDYQKTMVEAHFQAANNPDFSDAINLFNITQTPDRVEEATINNSRKYRYVRYFSGPSYRTDVAELQFYGSANGALDGTKLSGRIMGYPEVPPTYGTPYELAFDGSLETFFSAYNDEQPSWVGLDLGKPHYLTKVKFAPRSDTNFILIGDTYELCYWDGGRWISMGKQVAREQELHYRQIPANGLYLLHNLTRGKEERIFTYENDRQVWW